MHDDKFLADLIGDIYDTTLDSKLWPSVLGKIAAYVGGPAASLFFKDVTSKTGETYYDNAFIDPHYIDLYFRKYIKLDPASTRQFFAEIDHPMATADLIPYEDFVTSRFYREWARPQGLVDFITVALDKSATGAIMFGVFRHERDGVATQDTRRRMRLLAPHMRRAISIGRLIDLSTAQAAMLADSLDGVKTALFFTDFEGRIVHANAAGHTMLSNGGVLSASKGCLMASDTDANSALQDALNAIRNGDAAAGSKGIIIPLASRAGDRFVASILPLTGGARQRMSTKYAASAVVFLHRPAFDAPSPPETIAKTYKLTPAELRILLAVVEIGGGPEIAATLGLAESTVKFHIRSLFDKTGVRRQADLVKLVAGFISPLA